VRKNKGERLTKASPNANPKFYDSKREEVKKLAQLGCTDKEIAAFLEIAEKTLQINFREELDWGRANLRQSIRKAQIQSAIQDKNSTMLIWLGKNYLGQKEPKTNVEHSGGITIEKVMFSANDKKS
jgi:hypothetical protein